MNFSVDVNIYTPKVTSIWYCLRASQRKKRWKTDWFSGCLVRHSILHRLLFFAALLRFVLPMRRRKLSNRSGMREVLDWVVVESSYDCL